VAEQIAVLDILSNGRCLFGFGRGRAELEFKGFRVPMAEARGRFLEASEIIVGCLAEDEFEYHGHFFDIPRISIRPRPASDPQERFYGSSMSAESAKIIAHLGFGMLLSTQKPWPDLGSDVVQFNRLTVEAGYTPRSPIIIGSVSVAESRNEAQERALEHIGSELTMIDAHYRYSEGQLSSITGYESYKSAESHFQRLGSHSFRKQAAAEYAEMQLVGTPNDCIDQILELHRHTGFERLVLEFSYGGLRQQEAEANMRMFAREVMPRVPNSSE
jgi:alkanesulfonate monooxygenase SsuD/methylene tetrahydromethanopterin reductase-like flavin-dependent oxidoreductase (luciferase family)